MRALISIGLALLALGGCNRGDSSGNLSASERNVTSELLITNDTTAIDAATGQAANMAADVDFIPEESNASDGDSPARPAASRRSSSPGTSAAEPRGSDSPDEDEPDTDTL